MYLPCSNAEQISLHLDMVCNKLNNHTPLQQGIRFYIPIESTSYLFVAHCHEFGNHTMDLFYQLKDNFKKSLIWLTNHEKELIYLGIFRDHPIEWMLKSDYSSLGFRLKVSQDLFYRTPTCIFVVNRLCTMCFYRLIQRTTFECLTKIFQ